MEGSSGCMEAYNRMSEANSFVRIHGEAGGVRLPLSDRFSECGCSKRCIPE
jgi:hypothetical protein